jgi:hypothetical protein
MRALIIAAGFALIAACSPSARAQVDATLEGTWAFQTEPYPASSGTIALMSGVAVMRAESSGYAIQLLANELVTQGAQSVVITARETCRGEMQGAQFTITCEMAEPLEGYQPDTFVLQTGEPNQLVGVLASASSGQVTFTRVR